MKKKGEAMGETMLMMYQIIFVTFVAFVILGVSGMFYDYTVNTRDSESMLIARTVMDCVISDGVFDIDSLSEEDREDIFAFCGFNSQINEKVFVSLEIFDGENSVDKIATGNEELLWVKKIYTSKLKTKSIDKYEPGYFNGEFPISILKNGEILKRNMLVEVIVKYDE